jgi:hypothetical protein
MRFNKILRFAGGRLQLAEKKLTIIDKKPASRNGAGMSKRVASREPLPAAARWFLGICLLIGLGERIGWAAIRRTPWATGEASNVAIALAQGRGFSDAFFLGQGPTAHLLPVAPAIAGAVYWLLGVQTPAAEALLCAWSISVSLGSYLFAYLTFGWLGTPRWARVAMIGFLLVAPIYTTNEVFEFRIWDGGLGLLCASAFLYVAVRADAGDPPRGFPFWCAVLPAFSFFVNPMIGVCAYVAWALYVLRHKRSMRAAAAAVGATTLALALMVGPWALRNSAAMGQPILLRDNFGMELAVANYPEALTGEDRNQTFYDHLEQIQPYIHPKAQRALLAAGGEVAYARQLGEQAKAWIRGHPRDFATLCWRHFGQMVLPGTWMFMTSHGVHLPGIRSALVRLVHVLGLLGLFLALAQREWRFGYVLPFAVVPLILYAPFQPIIRYTWLVYPVLAFCMASLMARLRLPALPSFFGHHEHAPLRTEMIVDHAA